MRNHDNHRIIRLIFLAAVLMIAYTRILLILLLSFAMSPTFANSVPAPARLPVIIDTDMAIDDWLAILYLAKNPNIEIKAITVTGTGEAHCGPGVKHARDLLKLAGYSNTPVICGAKNSLAGGHEFPQQWRDQVDNLLGLHIEAADWPKTEDTSVAALWDKVIATSSQPVSMIALGPLTNLAQAFTDEPTLIKAFKMIYVMGGAFNVIGNVKESAPEIDNETAEWNIFADPLAAQNVVASGAPLTFVGLDVTNKVPLDLKFYNLVKAQARTPAALFVLQTLNKRADFVHDEGWFFWDPLTAAIAADESIAIIEELPVKVLYAPIQKSGQTLISDDGFPVRVALDVKAENFGQHFIDILNQEP